MSASHRTGGRTIALMAALALAAAWAAAPIVQAADPEPATRGKRLYSFYCSNCHGKSGSGDGPTSELLTIKPADLTRIAERNGGEFPREQVYETIDGRVTVPGHGTRQMPIWGLAFQELDKDTDQEDEVRQRILQLVQYLESIQASP